MHLLLCFLFLLYVKFKNHTRSEMQAIWIDVHSMFSDQTFILTQYYHLTTFISHQIMTPKFKGIDNNFQFHVMYHTMFFMLLQLSRHLAYHMSFLCQIPSKPYLLALVHTTKSLFGSTILHIGVVVSNCFNLLKLS